MAKRKTIAVLGGGSAGFTAARTASNLGADVVFCMGDNHALASLCVNRGCMPSKAMFLPIDTMHHAREQKHLRVEAIRPEAYLEQIVSWKDREIARFRAYRQKAIRDHESDDFRIVRANARFVDAHTLEAGGERITFDAAIIATGSAPVLPPIDGLAELQNDVWDNDALLSNTRLPQSLVMIGAGAIGLEFALRYARLGCDVTVVARSRPLSRYPERFGQRLAEIYEHNGVRMLLGAKTLAIRRDIEGWFVIETETNGRFEPVTGQAVALAVGRRPALEGLNLQAAGVELDERGRVQIGEDMRTASQPHIFAAGDAIGRRMVVHQAHIEAGIAGENATDEGDRVWHRRADVQVVYSDPEFAYVGLTPEAAVAAGHQLVSASKESRLVGKLHLGGDDMGFGEFIADRNSDRLLGAGLLCEGASDMIHLPGYVIDHEHTVHDAASAEYYHPTRIEIVSGIFDALCKELGGHPFRRADQRSG